MELVIFTSNSEISFVSASASASRWEFDDTVLFIQTQTITMLRIFNQTQLDLTELGLKKGETVQPNFFKAWMIIIPSVPPIEFF